MNSRKTELAVGAFAIIIFAILTFMTFKVGEFTIGKKSGYTVYAYFRDTAGLYEQTKIKVAGVDAGTIEDIGLVNGVARLTLRVDPDIKLYSDATAGIRSTGLLGDKFLELTVGSVPPLLKDGDTLRNTEEFVDLDAMFKNLNKLTGNVNQIVDSINEPEIKDALRETVTNLRDITASLETVVTGNQDRLNQIIARVDSLTTSLDEIMAQNKEPIRNTIANLEELSGSLKDDAPGLIAGINNTVSELRAMIQENRSDVNNLITKTSSTMDSINVVARKVEKGEGTLGKLVNDEKLYYAVTNAVSSVSNTVSAIERFRTFVTFRGQYLERLEEGKGEFYLTLQPKKDKYYILGVVGDPVGMVDTTDTYVNGVLTREEKVEKDLEFTAQFAKRFNDTALRIGITENTFGVGADQFFHDDKVRVYADAWDFGKDEHLAERPHVNVGVDYFVFKNVFLSGGLDNVLNSNRFGVFAGGGVRFEDEDFKYLFGTSIPRSLK